MITVPIAPFLVTVAIAFIAGAAALGMTRRGQKYGRRFVGPYMDNPHTRAPDTFTLTEPIMAGDLKRIWASNREREQAAATVTEAFLTGRITRDERDWRLRQISRARTLGDIAQLTGDLPVPPALREVGADLPAPATAAPVGGSG